MFVAPPKLSPTTNCELGLPTVWMRGVSGQLVAPGAMFCVTLTLAKAGPTSEIVPKTNAILSLNFILLLIRIQTLDALCRRFPVLSRTISEILRPHIIRDSHSGTNGEHARFDMLAPERNCR